MHSHVSVAADLPPWSCFRTGHTKMNVGFLDLKASQHRETLNSGSRVRVASAARAVRLQEVEGDSL